jgi:uncharacterized protein (DUF1501 family)
MTHSQNNSGQLSRRDVLRVGGLASMGLTLPQLLSLRETSAARKSSTFGRARRVIMLFLHGGHPQQETFDPKPDGPSAVRGEFGAIATAVPGVHFSELLPNCAAIMDRLAIVRSMSHENANHVQACLPAQTGHKHPPEFQSKGDFPPSDTDFPPIGAVLDHLRPARAKLPTWVRIGPLMRRSNGTTLHGQVPGLLGKQHSSFVVDQPLLPADVRIKALEPLKGLSGLRLRDRANLRTEFNQLSNQLDQVAEQHDLDGFYQRAANLLSSPKTKAAFDLAREPAAIRERYGNTEFGQRCLLARRLIEAGVPMVNVSYCHTPSGSWDTHGQNFTKMKDQLGPDLDTAFPALVEDLAERGMLDDTLVIVNAEFGRTPKINSNAGRDHWPWVYSLALAGAGIRAGTVYGASDASAAYPASTPRDPADMAATLYHLLGIDPETRIHDFLGRPHSLVIGDPIEEILA